MTRKTRARDRVFSPYSGDGLLGGVALVAVLQPEGCTKCDCFETAGGHSACIDFCTANAAYHMAIR